MDYAQDLIGQTVTPGGPLTLRGVDPDHGLMLRVCVPQCLATVAVFNLLVATGVVDPHLPAIAWGYLVVAVAPGAALVASRGVRLAAYGVGLEGASSSLVAALPVAIAVANITLLLAMPSGTAQPSPTFALATSAAGPVLLYAAHVAVQEFLARGCQVTLRAHVGTHASVWLAAALFALFHVHHGATVTLASGAVGVVIGYLYARYPNIAGAWLVHLVAGLTAIFAGAL